MWGPSNISNGSLFEKTSTDHDMKNCESLVNNECVSLMGNEHVIIDQNNNRESAEDVVGAYGDQGSKKNPFARSAFPKILEGGLFNQGTDFEAHANSIWNKYYTD
jgi:hypothetical protein